MRRLPFQPRPRRFPPRRREGIILFVVTVVIAALALGGMSLLALMRVELEATRHRLDDLDLENTSRSAAALTVALSGMTPAQRERLGGIYDNRALFCNRVVLPTVDGGTGAAWTILSPRLEAERSGVRYGLVNESTRLNLAALLEWDRETPGAAKETLMRLPGMTSVMADSLLDWIDLDEATRPDGAEASYYASHRLTYSPRNATPVSLDEILLVRGITRYQIYGVDTMYNFSGGARDRSTAADAARESGPIGSLGTSAANARGMRGGVAGVPDGDADTEVTIPWSRLLTVFSAERDVDPDGRTKIDLNEKDLRFLYDELDAALGEPAAAFVVLCRQYGPAPGAARDSAAAPKESDIDFGLPARWTFKTPLDVAGASVRAGGKVYASPISDRRESVTALFEFLDYASVGSSAVIVGRVNVNEAPRAVLGLVPGLDDTAVTRILDSRPTPGRPVPKAYRHAAWLFADGIVDLDRMKRLWGKLTVGGDVFRAQIVAFSETSGAARRAEIVVDASVIPPRQVFYKDLTMLGRGFSDDVLLGRRTSVSDAAPSQIGTLSSGAAPDGGLPPPGDDPFESIEGLTPP